MPPKPQILVSGSGLVPTSSPGFEHWIVNSECVPELGHQGTLERFVKIFALALSLDGTASENVRNKPRSFGDGVVPSCHLLLDPEDFEPNNSL